MTKPKQKYTWHSKESYERAIAWRRNRIFSEATRLKISNSLKRYYSNNGGRTWSIGRQDGRYNGMWKRKHSEETKHHISLRMLEYWKRKKHGN